MNRLNFSTVLLVIISLSNLSFSMGTALAVTEKKSAQNTLIKAKEKVINDEVAQHRYQYQVLNENNLPQHQLYIAQGIIPKPTSPKPTKPNNINPYRTTTPDREIAPDLDPSPKFEGSNISRPEEIDWTKIRNRKPINETAKGATIFVGTYGGGEIVCFLLTGRSCILCEDKEDCDRKERLIEKLNFIQ